MTKRKNLERNGVFLDKNFALGLVMLKPVRKNGTFHWTACNAYFLHCELILRVDGGDW